MHVMLSLSQAFLMRISVSAAGGGRKTPSGALEHFSLVQDADQRLDLVVIRREIFIGNRPIITQAIARIG